MGNLRRRWLRAANAIACVTITTFAQATPASDVDASRRLHALDCARVTAADVQGTLAHFPAPQVIALQGSVPIVTMAPLLAFIEAMGYPPAQLMQSGDNPRSRSSYVDARRIVGEMAWHYERDGLMPVLIGHSQGGMIVIKALHELADSRSTTPIVVWPPGSDAPQRRSTIADPFTGERREVSSLRVDFASAMVTGSLPRIVLGQWGMLPLLREVPDSVRDFIGFSIPWDPIAGTGADPAPYRAIGTAHVRNVVLPVSYSHVSLPRADHLASQPATRAWIDAFHPEERSPLPDAQDTSNLLVAAELWYGLRRHWCVGAKRVALRERVPAPTGEADARASRASR